VNWKGHYINTISLNVRYFQQVGRPHQHVVCSHRFWCCMKYILFTNYYMKYWNMTKLKYLKNLPEKFYTTNKLWVFRASVYNFYPLAFVVASRWNTAAGKLVTVLLENITLVIFDCGIVIKNLNSYRIIKLRF